MCGCAQRISHVVILGVLYRVANRRWLAEVLPSNRHIKLFLRDCLVKEGSISVMPCIEQLSDRLARITPPIEIVLSGC